MANEMRLIDANAMDALENLDYVYDPVRDGCEWYRAADVWSCIEDQPTVDAVPVVHGRWIFRKHGVLGHSVKCSTCGFGCPLVNKKTWLEYHGHKHCGCCGSQMDKEA